MVGSIKLVTDQQIPEIMRAKDAGELDGLKANRAIDVWGIGELVLHTLTGKPLFASRKEASAALVKAHKVWRGLLGWGGVELWVIRARPKP